MGETKTHLLSVLTAVGEKPKKMEEEKTWSTWSWEDTSDKY